MRHSEKVLATPMKGCCELIHEYLFSHSLSINELLKAGKKFTVPLTRTKHDKFRLIGQIAKQISPV